jgi:hypothetical protein
MARPSRREHPVGPEINVDREASSARTGFSRFEMRPVETAPIVTRLRHPSRCTGRPLDLYAAVVTATTCLGVVAQARDFEPQTLTRIRQLPKDIKAPKGSIAHSNGPTRTARTY